MKKLTLPPAVILIASAIYFLIASVALAQEPAADNNNKQDNKLVKYCMSTDNGKTFITGADGKQVSEPVTFQNGATVSLDGIITWKDGSKTTLEFGDCVGVDILGAVYVAKSPVTHEKSTSGIMSKK